VELGDWQGDSWIITSGLSAGDRVIVDGVMKIGPGAQVRVAELSSGSGGAPATPSSGESKSTQRSIAAAGK
jgi:membrane fusion protein (multidrug efflux system)